MRSLYAKLGEHVEEVPLVRRAACFALLLSSVTGCAALFHEPRPDLELAVEQRPWRVRCGWVLPAAAELGASPNPRADGWAWAGDTALRRLIVAGRIEDGFFLVESVPDKDDRDVLPVPATAREVEHACVVALDRAVEGEQPRLYAVMATRDDEGVYVPEAPAADLPEPALLVRATSARCSTRPRARPATGAS
ncbi:MAG: hypothetical protein ACREI8_06000 [Myxococcota bacterium]